MGNYLTPFLRWSRENRSAYRRAQFEAAKDTSPTLHRCEVCGLTEVTDPHTDFRVASDGKEYCINHLPREKIES
jgi:hypothetical protein